MINLRLELVYLSSSILLVKILNKSKRYDAIFGFHFDTLLFVNKIFVIYFNFFLAFCHNYDSFLINFNYYDFNDFIVNIDKKLII